MELPVIYNRSLLSFANYNITDPIQYAQFVMMAQKLLDDAQEDIRKVEEAESKDRSQQRCNQIEEELMMNMWHPSRIELLRDLGFEFEDM